MKANPSPRLETRTMAIPLSAAEFEALEFFSAWRGTTLAEAGRESLLACLSAWADDVQIAARGEPLCGLSFTRHQMAMARKFYPRLLELAPAVGWEVWKGGAVEGKEAA